MKTIKPFLVGERVWFLEEKHPYKIISTNNRFSIATKPFNIKKTVLYTIIDNERMIRGRENLIFGMGAETKEQCDEMLKRISSEETEISIRNYVCLNIEKRQ